MRSLPLKAAAISGVMPERPEVWIGAVRQQQRDGRVALIFGGAEERGRAGEVAGVDRCALLVAPVIDHDGNF